MNAFDGATTILGIVIGVNVTGITNELSVVWPGLGATLAMSLSGFFGAYITEEAERTRTLNQLEKSMLVELKNSVVGRASRFASIWAALIDGLSPALTGLICLLPFFFSYYGLFPINFAIQLSIVTTLVILFLLGAYLGRISKRNLFLQGLKLFIIGVVITVIFLALKIV